MSPVLRKLELVLSGYASQCLQTHPTSDPCVLGGLGLFFIQEGFNGIQGAAPTEVELFATPKACLGHLMFMERSVWAQ